MNFINVGSYLRLVWWVWLGLMLLTFVGGVMWYLGANTEPILVIFSVFIALLAEGMAFLRSWQDRQDQLRSSAVYIQTAHDEGTLIRNTVIDQSERIQNLIRQEKHRIPVKIENQAEFDEADFRTLQRLWKFINWVTVYSLLQGYADGLVYSQYIEASEQYYYARINPSNKLYNKELETKLAEFDKAFFIVLHQGGLLFVSHTGDTFIPMYKTQSYKYKYAHDNMRKYERFIKKAVIPTYKIYEEFIELLKERGIHSKIEYGGE
jgi:hypothetical protein